MSRPLSSLTGHVSPEESRDGSGASGLCRELSRAPQCWPSCPSSSDQSSLSWLSTQVLYFYIEGQEPSPDGFFSLLDLPCPSVILSRKRKYTGHSRVLCYQQNRTALVCGARRGSTLSSPGCCPILSLFLFFFPSPLYIAGDERGRYTSPSQPIRRKRNVRKNRQRVLFANARSRYNSKRLA